MVGWMDEAGREWLCWPGEDLWELGALRSRWRKHVSELLAISAGDMCLVWGGYLIAAMRSFHPCH